MSETPKTPIPEIVMSSDRYAGDDIHSVSCLIKFGPIYRAIMMQHLGQCGPDILEGRDELARLIVRSVNAHQKLIDALYEISSFAVGNGDVCEIIAKKARAAARLAESEDGLGGQ